MQDTSSTPTKSSPSCHHERHLNGIKLKIYNLCYRLGKKSKDGSVSLTNEMIAYLIGRPLRGEKRPGGHLSRAKSDLVRDGWFEFLGIVKDPKSGIWRGARYRAVSHDDWVRRRQASGIGDPCALLGAHGEMVAVRTSRSNTVRTSESNTVRTPRCAHSVVSTTVGKAQAARRERGPACLCWIGETEDYVAAGGFLATRRVSPDESPATKAQRDRGWFLEIVQEGKSKLARWMSEHTGEITEAFWLASSLQFAFCVRARAVGKLHPEDEGSHFVFLGFVGGEKVFEYTLPALLKVAKFAGTDLAASYRILQHALACHCEVEGADSVETFFGRDWKKAAAISIHCLNVWRYRGGEDAFADWYDPDMQPRRAEPPEMPEASEEEEAEAVCVGAIADSTLMLERRFLRVM